MTGGRRGLCTANAYYSPPSQVYGAGRGGRPWGGGRGHAWGGGISAARPPADTTRDTGAAYPMPDTQASGWLGAVDHVLRRMTQLAASIADLHDRITAGGRTAESGGSNELRK